MPIKSFNKTSTSVTIAVLAWFALGLQLALMLRNAPAIGFSTEATLINFLSYFTILSNLMVAITLTVKKDSTFSNVRVQSAIAVYIFIVGLVYNLVLRNIWSPKGWQLVADNLLHVVVPALYIIYWFFFVPQKVLHWKHLFPWLIFPLLYLVYSLIRGDQTGWYPYPFLNTELHGYGKVLLNATFVLIAFLITSLALISINRAGKVKRT